MNHTPDTGHRRQRRQLGPRQAATLLDEATRANWRASATALAVVAVGAIAALAGPAGAWAVAGEGLFVVLVGRAVAVAWQQRRSAVRP